MSQIYYFTVKKRTKIHEFYFRFDRLYYKMQQRIISITIGFHIDQIFEIQYGEAQRVSLAIILIHKVAQAQYDFE